MINHHLIYLVKLHRKPQKIMLPKAVTTKFLFLSLKTISSKIPSPLWLYLNGITLILTFVIVQLKQCLKNDMSVFFLYFVKM